VIFLFLDKCGILIRYRNNNNNNNLIYKAPKALASEELAAGQLWVLTKSLMEEA